MSAPEPLWVREDRVNEVLREALHYAVQNGGNVAKSVAWDVSHYFRKNLASAIEAPSGVETAQTGSTEGESAAPERGDAQ